MPKRCCGVLEGERVFQRDLANVLQGGWVWLLVGNLGNRNGNKVGVTFMLYVDLVERPNCQDVHGVDEQIARLKSSF